LPAFARDPLRRLYRLVVPAPPAVQEIDIGSFAGYEFAYRKGSVDPLVLAESFDKDVYFPGVPEYTAAEDHVMIDVGAHIGTFAVHASRKVPRGRVIAVEACRATYCLLRINAALNRADNVTSMHVALEDRPGAISLHLAFANWGHTTVTERGSGQSEQVTAITLQELLDLQKIAYCHFMKLNCEGAEFPILLSSSAETLQRFGVILALYHCDLYGGPATERDLAAHLQGAGFRTTFRQQTAKRGWLIAQRSGEPPTSRTAPPRGHP